MGNPNGLESESRAVAYLKIPGDTVDPTLPKFVTEYATDANDADFNDSGTVGGIDFGTVTQDRQEGKIRC
jgi:hypothetical protein